MEKSKEAVETNAKIDRLLLAVNSAFDSLVERKNDFNATDVKEMLQGSKDTQMTLLKLFDRHIEEVKSRVGIDISHRTLPNYIYTRNRLAEFINCRFKVSDLAFCQLNELFIREFQEYVVIEKRLGSPDCASLFGHTEKDLPYRVQGRTFGQVLF